MDELLTKIDYLQTALIGLTGIYLGAVATITINAYLRGKTLAEIGSFFGGMIAPVALVWVVYNQLDQSYYTKQNSEYIAQQIKENEIKSQPIFHIYSNQISRIEIRSFDDLYNGIILPQFYADIRKIHPKSKLIESLEADYKKNKEKITQYSKINISITNSGGNAYNISIINPYKYMAFERPKNRNIFTNETLNIKSEISLQYYFKDPKEKYKIEILFDDYNGVKRKCEITFGIERTLKKILSDNLKLAKINAHSKSEYNKYIEESSKNHIAENLFFESAPFEKEKFSVN